MTSKKKIANLFLIAVVILSSCFYIYYITQNKGIITISQNETFNEFQDLKLSEGKTKFFDVTYKFSDLRNKDFITKGKEAFFLKSQPNIIELSIVHTFTQLNDGTTLNIKSNKAKYFKDTKNINYYDKVVITNKQSLLTSDNAIFNSSKNKITLEDNVVFKNINTTIKSDRASLNTVTNNLEIFMKKKTERVYGRREQK